MPDQPGRSTSSAEDRIAALLAYCDEIDAKAKAAWEDYSRWIEGRPSSPVPMGVPTLDTTKVREFLTAPARGLPSPESTSGSYQPPTEGQR